MHFSSKLNAGIAGLPDSLLECTREPLLSDGEKVNLLFGSSNHALVAIADEFGAKVMGCVIQKLLNPHAPFEMLQLGSKPVLQGRGEVPPHLGFRQNRLPTLP